MRLRKKIKINPLFSPKCCLCSVSSACTPSPRAPYSVFHQSPCLFRFKHQCAHRLFGATHNDDRRNLASVFLSAIYTESKCVGAAA